MTTFKKPRPQPAFMQKLADLFHNGSKAKSTNLLSPKHIQQQAMQNETETKSKLDKLTIKPEATLHIGSNKSVYPLKLTLHSSGGLLPQLGKQIDAILSALNLFFIINKRSFQMRTSQ